jgi:branched-chain amino acid transport system ATP-binding protein
MSGLRAGGPGMSDGLSVAGLSVSYGKAPALQGVDAVFRPGALTAVVGPNGAGKSSLLLALSGAVVAKGDLSLDGKPIGRLSARQRARDGIAIVPQGRQVFPRLTVTENLQVRAAVLGLGKSAVDGALDMFPVLRERQSALAGVLSGGEQQMLAVSRALMGEPRVLLMDEMSTGLAPMVVQRLMRTAADLAKGGGVVVVAEPAIAAIQSWLDGGYVLLRGAVVGQGSSGPEVAQRYRKSMGVSA